MCIRDRNTTLTEISRRMEEGNEKINTRIDVEISVVREEVIEVTTRISPRRRKITSKKKSKQIKITYLIGGAFVTLDF